MVPLMRRMRVRVRPGLERTRAKCFGSCFGELENGSFDRNLGK